MATIEDTQDWRSRLAGGEVLPAVPLTLDDDGVWSQRHQRALLRYYIDSGAGGIAIGVHSTQFAIRDPKYGLFDPVLRVASETLNESAPKDFIRIAGICGRTDQAVSEAELADKYGYHAGLLSLTAFQDASDSEMIDHARTVSEVIPVVGFYLQSAVGGRVLSHSFWRQFCEIQNVVAIKIAAFNRYHTWDVIRAVIESGREDIALYTGNDDNIIADLITPFHWQGKTRFIIGGLLGQWAVWTKAAVELLGRIKRLRGQDTVPSDLLTLNASLTDANAVIFDAANDFASCIPGIMEILRRQGLAPSTRCLDTEEVLSPNQAEELTRVSNAYPELTDDKFVMENLSRWLE